MQTQKIQRFWQRFLRESGLPTGTPLYGSFAFGEEAIADDLLARVLCGRKRATSSTVIAYEQEGEPMPTVGSYAVVLNAAGAPRCVIRVEQVDIYPFNEMTFDVIREEGEDDCLETWQEAHKQFFTADGVQLGYAFAEDMPILFERFSMVYREEERE